MSERRAFAGPSLGPVEIDTLADLKAGHRSLYTHELGRLGPDRLQVLDVDTSEVNACEAALRDIADLAGLVNSTDTWAIPGAELARRLALAGPAAGTVTPLVTPRSA